MTVRLVLLAGALLLSACSATIFGWEPCVSHADCHGAFGRGWTCAGEGYCVQSPAPARCTSNPPELLSDPLGTADTITIATLYDDSNLGFHHVAQATALVAKQLNEHDGLDGQPFGLITCTNEGESEYDELDNVQSAVALAEWLADAGGVHAILGPERSTEAEAVYSVLAPRGVVLMTPSATSPALTALDGLTATDEEPGLLWRTVPPDDLQGQVIAMDMEARVVERVAVIHETGAYGEGLAQAFLGPFAAAGHSADQFPYSTDGEMAAAVAQVGDGDYEEVLFISSVTPTIVSFLHAASGIPTYETMGIFLTDGAYVEDMLDDARDAASGLFPNIRGTVPRFSSDTVLYNTFEASYRAEYGGEDPAEFGFTAHAYDAAWLLAYGIAWSSYREGGVFGTGIARGLRRVTGGEPVNIGPNTWTTVRARFGSGQRVDVTGATGRLDYDPETEETTAPIIVWTVDPDGEHLRIDGCVDLEGLDPECVHPPSWPD